VTGRRLNLWLALGGHPLRGPGHHRLESGDALALAILFAIVLTAVAVGL
jgi:hypothetical protein